MLVQIKKGEKEKYVGIVKINLVDYIDTSSNGASKNGQRHVLPLDKCADKNAKVAFTIRSVLVSANVSASETISLASGANSFGSGLDSNFDFQELESDYDESN